MIQRFAVLLSALAVLAGATPALAQDDDVATRARTQFERGVERVEAEDYEGALEAFQEAAHAGDIDASEANPDWRLPELTNELALIAKNERRFLGLSEQDTGFDPEQHKGEVVVSTMHKAKGLEWDRVYLMSVNTYDFPSGMVHDTYISEKWYIRDGLNLQAEALAPRLRARAPAFAVCGPDTRQAPIDRHLEYRARQSPTDAGPAVDRAEQFLGGNLP